MNKKRKKKMAMFKYLMLVVVAAVLAVGCHSGSNPDELKKIGYANGCVDSVHYVLGTLHMDADEAKLAAFCNARAEEWIKNNK